MIPRGASLAVIRPMDVICESDWPRRANLHRPSSANDTGIENDKTSRIGDAGWIHWFHYSTHSDHWSQNYEIVEP